MSIILWFIITSQSVTISEVFGLQYPNAGFSEWGLKFLVEGAKHDVDEPPNVPRVLPEYDFIIVGAGTAGSVLANRLSEVSDWKILLIEAGGKENYIMDIPILATWFHFTETNWGYKSEPSDNVCLSMTNKQCVYPRGKVMGGSSSINYMIYTRGHRRNYDRWEKMGNTGWGYKDILRYFLQLENMLIPEFAVDKKYHSTSGELAITYAPYRTPLAEAFVQGGKELGYKVIDYNGETQTGFAYLQSTTRNGTRWSASKTFLHPIRRRKNFHVKKRSLVTKVLITPDTKTAYGVEFVCDNKKYVVRARKEVILSGGAINSPQLLMLSGIGPKEHLDDMKIPVVQDLKVGYNLMEHPGMVSGVFLVNESVSLVTEEILDDGESIVEFMAHHTGPLSVPAACEGIAFFDTKNLKDPDGDPDIELLFFGGGIPSEETYYRVVGLSDEFYNSVFKDVKGAHSWQIVPIAIQPKSRGRIMLRSLNPHRKPLLYYDLFEDPEDLEKLVIAMKEMVKLSKTSAFQKFGSKLHAVPVPGCEHFAFASDDYWRCVGRHTATGIWHLCGSCKMGPSSDPDAVVDPRLRVYGVKNLRVIDASIMPMVPAAHTNVPTMVVAAKGADMIKERLEGLS